MEVRPIDWTGLPSRFMNDGELEVLVALARTVTELHTVVEIGVNDGRTALCLMRELPAIRQYVGVDVFPGYVTPCRVQRAEVPANPGRLVLADRRFKLMLRSRGSRDLRADDLPPADLVFIDGDHSEQGVLWDAELAMRIIRPGGIVVYHDYHSLGTVGVAGALHRLSDHGRLILQVEGTWFAVERF